MWKACALSFACQDPSPGRNPKSEKETIQLYPNPLTPNPSMALCFKNWDGHGILLPAVCVLQKHEAYVKQPAILVVKMQIAVDWNPIQ